MQLRWPDVQDAQQFLRRYLAPTRLLGAPSLERGNAEVYLKLESEMPTGSFKVRGALYAPHAEMTRRQVTEVVASSTGNHGAAVAYAATLLNLPAKIFLPLNVNPAKQARIRACGAEIGERAKTSLKTSKARRTMPSRLVAFAKLRHQFRRSRRNSDHLHRNNRPIVERFGDLGTNG